MELSENNLTFVLSSNFMFASISLIPFNYLIVALTSTAVFDGFIQ